MTHTLLRLAAFILLVVTAWRTQAQPTQQADETSTLQLRTVARSFAEAIESKNVDGLKRLLGKTYLGVDVNGQAYDRAGRISSLEQSELKLSSVKGTDQQVNAVGDTAVVSGVFDVKGEANGKDVSGQYRYVDVWKKVDGDWKVIASTMTRITQAQSP